MIKLWRWIKRLRWLYLGSNVPDLVKERFCCPDCGDTVFEVIEILETAKGKPPFKVKYECVNCHNVTFTGVCPIWRVSLPSKEASKVIMANYKKHIENADKIIND